MIRKLNLAALIATLLAAGTLHADETDKPTAFPKLNEALALAQTESAAERQQLRRILPQLGEAELAALCGQLKPWEASADSPADFVLQALTIELSRPAMTSQRGRMAEVLGQQLAQPHADEIKQLLIEQLGYLGDERAAPAIAHLLTNERLSAAAVEALVMIGGERAQRELRLAIDQTKGRQRIGVIGGIARLKDPRAVTTLWGETRGSEPAVRRAALDALAKLGSKPIDVAAGDLVGENAWYVASMQLADLLNAAEQMAASGQRRQALRLVNDFKQQVETLSAYHHDLPLVHLYCAALWTRAMVDQTNAVETVVAALVDENPIYARAAQDVAVAMRGPGVAAALGEALTTDDAVLQGKLITVLVERRSDRALPALIGLALSKEAQRGVREQALLGLAQLGGKKSINVLISAAKSDRAVLRTVEEALVTIPGDDVSMRLGEELDDAPELVKTVLLRALARRYAPEQIPSILDELDADSERVRATALQALADLGGADEIPDVLTVLSETESDRVRRAAEEALVALARRSVGDERGRAAVLKRLDPQDPVRYVSLLRVVSSLGGDAGLRALRAALDDEREEVRDEAYRMLAKWPDAEDAGTMLKIADAAESTKHHVLAMRAFTELFGQFDSRPITDQLALFETGLETARRDDEKRQVIAKLATADDGRVLEALDDLLASELEHEAAAAIVSVCENILPAGWERARTTLNRVLADIADEDIRGRAQRVLDRVAEMGGYVTEWQVAGPYRDSQTPREELLHRVFAPEPGAEMSADIQWRSQFINDGARYWYIDLGKSLSCGNCAGYLRTFVFSPSEQPVRLEIGSDDAVKVWVNDDVVHENIDWRGCERGQDIAAGTLVAGWNVVMMKVVNGGGGYAASLRLRTPEGEELPELRYSATAPTQLEKRGKI